MGLAIFAVVCLVLGVIGTVVKVPTDEEMFKSKSDKELINQYEQLTKKIAAEAYAGSKCQGIGSTAAVNACNNRITNYRFSATKIARELERRGYEVDRSKMNGQAVKQSSGQASVVKRAVAGAVIAGPAGAVIGAASAIDKNNKNAK